MNFIKIFGVSTVLAIAVIYVVSHSIENGDVNAMSMYFVVFLIPAILLALLNGAYLVSINSGYSLQKKVILSLLPILILTPIAFVKDVSISFIDGSLGFVGLIGAISIGITNLLWCIQMKRASQKSLSN